MEFGDSSAAGEHVAAVDYAINNLLVVATFASYSVFGAPIVDQMSSSSV